ncbi:hypothetical protein D3C84_717230 [compost metagenome]
MDQTLEHFEHPLLGWQIEIDQQIAAEHKVITARLGLQCRIKHIPHLQLDLLAHTLMNHVAVVAFVKMPLAKLKVRAAKGIAPIQPLLGPVDRQGTDVHAIDPERVPGNAGVKQGHGDGVRLFTGGARQAEDTQRPRPGQLGQTFAGKARQRRERFWISKEPGLRNNHRFDKRLLLRCRLLQAQPVVIQVVGTQCGATLA